MIIAFQVVLLIFMVISFICSAGEKTNKDVRNSYLAFFCSVNNRIHRNGGSIVNKTLREQLEKVFKESKDNPFFKGYDPQLFFNHTGKPKKKNKEKLTHSDWEQIMGVNRPRYKRAKGGALRQR